MKSNMPFNAKKPKQELGIFCHRADENLNFQNCCNNTASTGIDVRRKFLAYCGNALRLCLRLFDKKKSSQLENS